jgi:hypothetical protein
MMNELDPSVFRLNQVADALRRGLLTGQELTSNEQIMRERGRASQQQDAYQNLLRQPGMLDPQGGLTGQALMQGALVSPDVYKQIWQIQQMQMNTQVERAMAQAQFVADEASGVDTVYREMLDSGRPEPEARIAAQAVYDQILPRLQQSNLFTSQQLKSFNPQFDPVKNRAVALQSKAHYENLTAYQRRQLSVAEKGQELETSRAKESALQWQTQFGLQQQRFEQEKAQSDLDQQYREARLKADRDAEAVRRLERSQEYGLRVRQTDIDEKRIAAEESRREAETLDRARLRSEALEERKSEQSLRMGELEEKNRTRQRDLGMTEGHRIINDQLLQGRMIPDSFAAEVGNAYEWQYTNPISYRGAKITSGQLHKLLEQKIAADPTHADYWKKFYEEKVHMPYDGYTNEYFDQRYPAKDK